MTEQMRRVRLDEGVDKYYIDGQPYSFGTGDEPVLPRTVGHNLVRQGKAHYAGDVFEVDDEEYREVIGCDGNGSEADKEPIEAFVADATVGDIEERIDGADEDEIEAMLEAEERNKARKTAIEALEEALEE